MARNFSTNQNRQLYVAETYGDVSENSAAQTITLKALGKGIDSANKSVYLLYKGADTVLKSALIPVKNIDYVKATKKEDLRTPFKSQVITLDPDVNGGNPLAGQDYILRIVLRQWVGMSDQDVYVKDAAVHATTGMDAAAFYKAMVKNLNLCFSREVGANKESNPYLKFEVLTKAVTVPDGEGGTKSISAGIQITEKEQPWTLGLEQQVPVLFDAVPTTIYSDSDDLIWGKVYDATAKKSAITVGTTGYGNGHNIADLEYFCMGERGDQYRMVGWPNIVPTKYFVDGSKEYNVLDIHFAFTDTGVNSYRSDKEITVVSTSEGVINGIVKDLVKETGLQVDDLSGSVPSTIEG